MTHLYEVFQVGARTKMGLLQQVAAQIPDKRHRILLSC